MSNQKKRKLRGIRQLGKAYEPVVTLQLQYRDFVSRNPDTCISYELYKDIQKNYFRRIALHIVKTCKDYILPRGLGSLGARLVRQKPRKRIDYNETMKAKAFLLSMGVKETELKNKKNPDGAYCYIVLRESGDYVQMYWDKRKVRHSDHPYIKGYDWVQGTRETSPKYGLTYWEQAKNFKDMLVLMLRGNPNAMHDFPEYQSMNTF